jgi:hypothetical protein
MGIDVGTWTPDSRIFITANETTKNMRLWDVSAVGSGGAPVLLDKLRIPIVTVNLEEFLCTGPSPPGGSCPTTPVYSLDRITVEPDGRRAQLWFRQKIGERHFERPLGFDLQTRQFDTAAGPPHPISDAAGRSAAIPLFPASPDKRLIAARTDIWSGVQQDDTLEWSLRVGPNTAAPAGRRAPKGVRLGRDAVALGGAALSPSERQLAVSWFSGEQTRVQLTDLDTGQTLRLVTLGSCYTRLSWLDDRQLVAVKEEECGSGGGGAAPPVLIDADEVAARPPEPLPDRCFARPTSDGLIALGAAACRGGGGGAGLWSWSAGNKAWTPLTAAGLPKGDIALLAAARNAPVIATLYRRSEGNAFGGTLAVLNRTTGQVVVTNDIHAFASGLFLSDDGRTALIATHDQSIVAQIDWGSGGSGGHIRVAPGPLRHGINFAALQRGTFLAGGYLESSVVVGESPDGATRRVASEGFSAVAGGFLKRFPGYWAAYSDGRIEFRGSADDREQLMLLPIEGGKFFAWRPDGRYDTNLPPDTDAVRWLMPDQPWRSLAPQTFMRQLYEPGLYRRTLSCSAAGTCDREFPAATGLADLNRVLPATRIATVRPGPTPLTAVVTVAASGQDEAGPDGARRASGLHNLRLFRDGRLVGEVAPPPADLRRGDTERWRAATRLAAGAAPAITRDFTVALPSGGRPVTFSAYAFNDDQVKGETATARFTPPPAAARPRRAFVLAIGIDHYPKAGLQSLRYAGADAELIADKLKLLAGKEAGRPDYEVRPLVLTTERDRDGKAQVSRRAIELALSLLAAPDPDGARRRELAGLGFGDGKFEPATPDDLVFIAFASHGGSDSKSGFFLVPGDAEQVPGKPLTEARNLISAGDLTAWLDPIDAGEITLLIDACHSAASVDAGGFKPGPMGDPGLGQLAFDKGLHILTATLGSDTAAEPDQLRHGVLSYVLAEEGLAGRADLNGDGRITLKEWLRYAVARVPVVSANPGLAGKTRDFDLGGNTTSESAKPQEPVLFDFTDSADKLVLRSGVSGGTKP